MNHYRYDLDKIVSSVDEKMEVPVDLDSILEIIICFFTDNSYKSKIILQSDVLHILKNLQDLVLFASSEIYANISEEKEELEIKNDEVFKELLKKIDFIPIDDLPFFQAILTTKKMAELISSSTQVTKYSYSPVVVLDESEIFELKNCESPNDIVIFTNYNNIFDQLMAEEEDDDESD